MAGFITPVPGGVGPMTIAAVSTLETGGNVFLMKGHQGRAGNCFSFYISETTEGNHSSAADETAPGKLPCVVKKKMRSGIANETRAGQQFP